jgi:DNA ligase 1
MSIDYEGARKRIDKLIRFLKAKVKAAPPKHGFGKHEEIIPVHTKTGKIAMQKRKVGVTKKKAPKKDKQPTGGKRVKLEHSVDNKKIPNPNNAGENANLTTPSFTRTLYSIDNKGKTRVWTIQVENGKYRFITGLEEGKLTTSKWTIAEEKNKGKKNHRNQTQQATFEGLAHITKQMKKGYGIDRKIATTNKGTIFKPMLAKKYSDLKSKVLKEVSRGGYVSQIKADGIRCVIDSDRAFSRENNDFSSVPHLDPLKKIAKKYNCLFDGELYNHAYFNDFGSISGMTRTQNKQAELQYWIFDCIFKDEPNLTYTQRMKKLQGMKEIQKEFGDTSFTDITNYPKNKRHIVIVPYDEVKSEKSIDSLYYDNYLENGFEGQMLKKDVPYENKRTPSLLKRKEFTDDEFVIMDAIEGKGNRSGTAGKLVFRLPSGKTFHADIMGSMDYRKKLLKNINKLKGKKATVKFFHYTVDGVPRHPNVKAIRDYE